MEREREREREAYLTVSGGGVDGDEWGVREGHHAGKARRGDQGKPKPLGHRGQQLIEGGEGLHHTTPHHTTPHHTPPHHTTPHHTTYAHTHIPARPRYVHEGDAAMGRERGKGMYL